MTPEENEVAGARFRAADRLASDIAWFERLIASLADNELILTIETPPHSRFAHDRITSNPKHGTVLTDLKAAMIAVLEQRIAESRRLYAEL